MTEKVYWISTSSDIGTFMDATQYLQKEYPSVVYHNVNTPRGEVRAANHDFEDAAAVIADVSRPSEWMDRQLEAAQEHGIPLLRLARVGSSAQANGLYSAKEAPSPLDDIVDHVDAFLAQVYRP